MGAASNQQTREDNDDDQGVMDLSSSRRNGDAPSPSISPSDSPTREPSPLVPQPVTEEMDTAAVNYPCHTCGEMFPSRSKQEQHILEHHSR